MGKKEIWEYIDKYKVLIGLIFSFIAYFFGYLRKFIYLNLLNVKASPLEIYQPLSFYTSGVLFVISAIIMPLLLVYSGYFIGERLKCISNGKIISIISKKIFIWMLSGLVFLVYILFFIFVLNSSEKFHFLFIFLYLIPMPIIVDDLSLRIFFLILMFFGAEFVSMGYFYSKQSLILTKLLYSMKFILLVCFWAIILFASQITESVLHLKYGADFSNAFSNSESYLGWIVTSEPTYYSINEDGMFYTKCAILNIKDDLYYVAVVDSNSASDGKEKYSLAIVPKSTVKRFEQINHFEIMHKKRKKDIDYIGTLLALLDKKKYKVIDTENLFSKYLVISEKAVFNLNFLYNEGNLSVNDNGILLIEQNGKKEGVFLNEIINEKRRRILEDALGSNIPIIDVIVLANATSTIEHSENFHKRIIKYDELVHFITKYEGDNLIDDNVEKILIELKNMDSL